MKYVELHTFSLTIKKIRHKTVITDKQLMNMPYFAFKVTAL